MSGNNGCNFAALSNYNSSGNMKLPVPMTSTQGFYVVPDYATFGYQTLTSEKSGQIPSCSGYFSLQGAYGSCSDSMTYSKRACN